MPVRMPVPSPVFCRIPPVRPVVLAWVRVAELTAHEVPAEVSGNCKVPPFRVTLLAHDAVFHRISVPLLTVVVPVYVGSVPTTVCEPAPVSATTTFSFPAPPSWIERPN